MPERHALFAGARTVLQVRRVNVVIATYASQRCSRLRRNHVRRRTVNMKKVLKLDDFLPYLLSVSSNAVSDTVASAYRNLFGLRVPEWRLVTVLAEGGAMSQQALCGRTRMDKVTVSRAAIA